MSDFLSNLIARSHADQSAIRPRLPSRFESAVAGNFSEVQSFAPATAAQKSPSESSPAAKLIATEELATEKPVAGVNDNPPTKKETAHTNAATAISTPRSDGASETGFSAKKTIVPNTAAPGETNHGVTAKTQSFQQSSERPAFQSRRQNFIPPNEPRPSAPAIHVTIGRVEVRAIQSPAPAPKPAKPAPPKLSLDDYLQKREGGAR